MTSFYNTIGGRKMALAFLAIAVGLAVEIIKGDVSSGLVALLLGVFTGYGAANAAEAIMAKPAVEQVPVPIQPPVDLSPIAQSQERLLKDVQTLQQASAVTLSKLAKFEVASGLDKLPG